jgi:hypothetical protein
MKLQCVDELYFQPTNAALVSINPANPGVLFSPGGNLTGSGEDQMFTYQIHYENLPTCNLRACLAGLAAGGLPDSCLLSNGPGDSTQPMQIKPGTVASVDELLEVGYYSGVDCWGDLIGRGPGVNIGEPQGGVFSTDGKLYYLANGGSYQGCHRDTNALRVFDTTTPVWTEIARAWDDYYGYFSYACKDGCTAPLDDEPEGIDYLDLTQVNAGPLTGHGQLHAMLYNNPVYGAGDTYLKHYYTTVP